MSSAAIDFPVVDAREREETDEEKLTKAALKLRGGGPVIFKWSRRVEKKLLPRWKRAFYVFFCREASEKLRVPPKAAQQLNTYSTLARAVAKCETPDDQILVMPHDHDYYQPDRLDVPVECRPRDPEDSARFDIVFSVFGDYPAQGETRLSVDELERVTQDINGIRRMAEGEGGQRMSNQAVAGCNKQCLVADVERCAVGWPDGSCGARGQGTQWPKDARAAYIPPDDWTVGDVIYAEPNGLIILDDGLNTYNQVRAKEWLDKHGAK